MRIIAGFLCLASMLLPTTSHAWWNNDWNFRKQITLDTTAAGADIKGSPAEVPVLVRLHTGNFGYFLDVAPGGADIRFVAGDDITPLKFHIEKFDPINEMAFIWVKAPRLIASSNTEKIWMYYGNHSVKSGEETSSTYGVEQALVFHFDADGNAPKDLTAYANNPVRFSAESVPASLIGAGGNFSGANQVVVTASPSLRLIPDNGWTFSSWVKIDQPQADAFILHMSDNSNELVIGMRDSAIYFGYGQVGASQTSKTADLTAGAWNHIAVVLNKDIMTLYVNGQQATAEKLNLLQMGGEISIGSSLTGSNGFIGQLDEVQIAKVARDADWIKSAAISQGPDAALLVYGGDEQNQGGGASESYFGVILQNVTIDGWVVIVILAVMAFISWMVMIAKGFVISSVRRENKAFLAAFRQLGTADPSKLDHKETETDREFDASPLTAALFGKHDQFQGSTIYRIYHAGIQEVQHRVGKAVGAQAAGITPQAIGTIKASLDATMVRETQKLNSQMVLLTIAISGGPFLGLLGTVVGVMITFAAIAATGDVNINAIAPGIAAALVATVAGLAVAIPALFGYNYLASRIKEINADMQVFADEFITKAAEHYVR